MKKSTPPTLTPLGKALRKLRVDLDLTASAMARKLGTAPSHLSQIETGKRTALPEFVALLAQHYPEVQKRREHYEFLATLSNPTLSIDLAPLSPLGRQTAALWAQVLPQLNDADLARVWDLLERLPSTP